MGKIIVQLYEIQEPREAERLVELKVDHIGSVILSPEAWKVPAIRDVVRLVRQSPSKSSLIPLLTKGDDILRALDYYQPDFAHFCELIPLAPRDRASREETCAELIRIQGLVKKEFPPIKIIRSVPFPEPGMKEPDAVREAILEIARMLGPHSDVFMTDTLRGCGGHRRGPAGDGIRRDHRGCLRLGDGPGPRRGKPDSRDPCRGDLPGERL